MRRERSRAAASSLVDRRPAARRRPASGRRGTRRWRRARATPSTRGLSAPVQPRQRRDRALPLARDLRQHVDARAHVLAALGVVGGGGRERRAASAPCARAFQAWKRAERRAERLGSPPTSLSDDEPVVAIEGGVLEPLAITGPVICWKRSTNSRRSARSASRDAVGIAQQQHVARGSRRSDVAGRAVAALGVADRARDVPRSRGARPRSVVARGRRCDRPGSRRSPRASARRRLSGVKSREQRCCSEMRSRRVREHVDLARHRRAHDQRFARRPGRRSRARPSRERAGRRARGRARRRRRRTGR